MINLCVNYILIMKNKLFLILTLMVFSCEESDDIVFIDCNGTENGDEMSCFGCTEKNSLNYDSFATQDDGSCIWSYQITQNQSFYFIEKIIDSTGNQVNVDSFYIGAFKNNNCLGSRMWNGPYTDVPVMGNSGLIDNYLNLDEIPSFKYYDVKENLVFNLYFDGICYDNANHTDIINCGFKNNGIYYINSLSLVY